jgi:hypothetical protein
LKYDCNKQTIEHLISRTKNALNIKATIEFGPVQEDRATIKITCEENIFMETFYLKEGRYSSLAEEEACGRLLEIIFLYGITRKMPQIKDGVIQN